MAYDKIDNKDLTVQIESNKIDVWVPEGLAIPDRSLEQQEFSLIPPKLLATTSLDSESHTLNYDSSGSRWFYSFDGKQKAPVSFFDVRVNNSSSGNAQVSKDFSRTVGPIIVQNRFPIPVSEGSMVSMAGRVQVRQPNLPLKEDNTNVPILVTIELYGVGYEQDEYGEEQDITLKLMSFTQNLQSSGNVGASLIRFTLPTMDYVPLPEGCDRVFLTVSYISGSTGIYSSISYNAESTGGFLTPSVAAPMNYCYLEEVNPLRVQVKQSDTENVINPNALSSTGVAFRNRGFFENVFPVFDFITINNSGFESDLLGWNGVSSPDGIDTLIKHSGTKSLRISGNSIVKDALLAENISVTEGENYYAEVWVRSNGTYLDSGQIGIAATCSDNGSSPTYPSFRLVNASTVGTTWILLSGIIKIPSGKNRMVARITVRDTVTGGTYYFDDFKLAKFQHDNELKIMGTPTTGTEVNIWEWNGKRQDLVTNVVCAPNEKKIIDVSSTTGMLEIAKPGTTTPANMAIIKQGVQSPIGENVWTRVNGFRSSASYPGTVIENNGFRIQFAGKVAVNAYLTFTSTPTTVYKGVRVLVNGVSSSDRTFTTSARTSGMSGKTPYINVVPGDLIEFQGIFNTPTTNRRGIAENTHFELIYSMQDTLGNDFYIESLLAKSWDDFDQIQNRISNISFIDIVDETASISIERLEADAGTFTIKFASANLDPRTNALLQIGKTIRIFGRHYGPGNKYKPVNWAGESLFSTVFVGKVKKINVVYDYKNEPQIEVTAYDIYQKADSVKLGFAYDTLEEYGPALHSLGEESFINGVEWTGQTAPMPSELKFFPSTFGDMTLIDALIMTRNTNKSFLYVNKNNQLISKNTLDTSLKLIFTDGSLPGDVSMNAVKQGINTESIINVIDIEENLIDRADIIDRTAGSASPPEKFKTIPGKTRTIRYQDNNSVASFGEYSKTFQVIRGTGSYTDIQNDNFGSRFDTWAEGIVQNFSQPNIYISEITSPVKDSDTLRMLLSLDILDKVWVCYKGETYEVNIRSIKQEIKPGKWTFTFRFLPQADQTYWS